MKRSMTHQDLVTSALPLVERMSRQLRRRIGPRVNRDDLQQIGQLALVEAADRFDATRGVPFELWAAPRVRGALIDGLAALTGLSRTHVRAITAYNNANTDERAKITRAPAILSMVDGELAEDLFDHSEFITPPRSPEDDSLRREAFSHVISALSQVNTEERELLTDHYIEGHTLAHLAEKRGVSRSWLSRLHQRALDRVRLAARNLTREPRAAHRFRVRSDRSASPPKDPPDA